MEVDFNKVKQSAEMIQLIILSILSEKGYTNDITFHGGTCERFCYKNPRYSEDLDFVTTNNIDFDAIVQTLQDELPKYITNKIKVVFSERNYSENIVQKIKVRVFPDNPNLRKIEIIVEFAMGIPNYTRVFVNVKEQGFDFSLNAERMEEILADKVISFGARKIWESTPFKARDLWDIYWLIQNNIQFYPSMVLKKIKDYKENYTNFLETFQKRLEILQDEKSIDAFQVGMRGFVKDKEAELVENEDFVKNLLSTISVFLSDALHKVEESKKNIEMPDR